MSFVNKDKGTRKVRYQSKISLSTSTSTSSISSRSRSHKVCKVTKNLAFSTRGPKREDPSSTRLPLIIKSHNLNSLISQFENLDSDTTSTTIARFSPPHRLRELSRRQKEDQISERCGCSPDLGISKKVEETWGKDPGDVSIQYENKVVYSRSPKPQFNLNSDLDVEKSQTQRSNSNFVDGETVKKDFQGCRRRIDFNNVALTQIFTNDYKRAVSMQEKIRFFDGSASEIESNKSRFYEITQAKSKLREVQESRDINETNNLRTLPKQFTTQTSSMNPSKIISEERLGNQNSALDPKTINKLSTKKRSPKNCSLNLSTKPPIIPDRRKGKAGLRSLYSKKNRNSPVRSVDVMDKLKIGDLEQDVKNEKIVHESLNKKLNMKVLSRKPSSKIEALFLQSMNHKHDSSENNQRHMNRPFLSPKKKQEVKKREGQNNEIVTEKELNAKKEVKFLNTRRKFEIKISHKESIKKDNCISDKQDTSALQSSKQDKEFSSEFLDGQPTYSSESLLKQYRDTMTDNVKNEKSGVTQKNSQKKNLTSSSTLCTDKVVQLTPTNTQGTDFSIPRRMAPVASSGLVGEKVKQFENIKSLRVSGAFPTERSITRRLNRSLRGFFEYWSSHEKMRGKNEISSIDELGDFCGDFQRIGTQSKKSKGILNSNVASSKDPLKAKNIEESSEKSSDSSSLDEMDVWIIKKVNCGLKQPKPLRAVEIKSMVLLCSSFGGGSKTSNIPGR